MDDLRKAAEMALPLLVAYQDYTGDLRIANECGKIIEALRQALAQPEQCICHRCINEKDLREGAFPLSSTRMILCPECGNKRCPKASDHRLDCTGSNESGQEGSVYTTPPSKPWVGLENIDFQYQPPAEVITMKYAEAILKEKNT